MNTTTTTTTKHRWQQRQHVIASTCGQYSTLYLLAFQQLLAELHTLVHAVVSNGFVVILDGQDCAHDLIGNLKLAQLCQLTKRIVRLLKKRKEEKKNGTHT